MSQQINLFRPELRKRRELLSAATLAAALLLVAAGMLAYAGHAKWELAQAGQRLVEADAGLAKLRGQLASLGTGPARAAAGMALLDEVARTGARVKARHGLIETLKGGGIGSAEGFSRYLEALARQRADGVWLTGVKVGAGAEFTLQGRALDAGLLPGYIRLLNNEEALRGKQIGQMNLLEKEEEVPVPAASGVAPRPVQGAHVPQGRPGRRYVEFTIGSGAAGG